MQVKLRLLTLRTEGRKDTVLKYHSQNALASMAIGGEILRIVLPQMTFISSGYDTQKVFLKTTMFSNYLLHNHLR